MSDHSNAYASATANALGANDVAKKTHSHLMFISQISREKGDHTSPLYTSRVAKDTGAWEENADLIINCWRIFGDGLGQDDVVMNIYIAKNRSGRLGEYALYWDGKSSTVRDMTEAEINDFAKRMGEVQGGTIPHAMVGRVTDCEVKERFENSDNMPKRKKGRFDNSGSNR